MSLPRIQFDPKISFGNLLTIFGGVVVLIVGWTTMQNDLKQEREARLEMRARVERLETKDEVILKVVTDNQRDVGAVLARLEAQMSILLNNARPQPPRP